MRSLQIGLAGILLLGLLEFAYLNTTAQVGDAIIIEGADHVRELSTAITPTLTSLVGNVETRITLEVADRVRWQALTTPPQPLATKVANIETRIILVTLDRVRHVALIIPSQRIRDALAAVADRIVLETADKNRFYPLVYPVGLIPDSQAPIISNGFLEVIDGQATLRWTTNEFAHCALSYGTSPGNYPSIIDILDWQTEFQVTLDNLLDDTVYYYKLHCYDLSNNVATSAEQSFELAGVKVVYLPLIQK